MKLRTSVRFLRLAGFRLATVLHGVSAFVPRGHGRASCNVSCSNGLFCTSISRGGGIAADGPSAPIEDDPWNLWPYFHESIRWHSDWTRWNATSLEVAERFRAYRHLKTDGENTTLQHNTYFYEDDRGTVNEGPLCGPWKISKNDSNMTDAYGIIVARSSMRSLCFPDRSLVWLMKDLPTPGTSPFAAELFLGDGDHLRVSVGIIYGADGKLARLSAIREDARDWGRFWSSSSLLQKHTDPLDRARVLRDFSSATTGTTTSCSSVKVPGPIRTSISGGDGIDGLKTNPEMVDENDVVFEMPDGIVVICPSKLPESKEDFVIAAGWKSTHQKSVIQARYKNSVMDEVVHIRWTAAAP